MGHRFGSGRRIRASVLCSLLVTVTAFQAVVGAEHADARACGRLVASGIATGYGANGFSYLADDAVRFTFSKGHDAARDFAIFQTHDPWGDTVLKTAIGGAHHSYRVFEPSQLAGFAFRK